MDIKEVKFKTTKPNVRELLLLQTFTMSGDLLMAANFVVARMDTDKEPEEAIQPLWELEADELYNLVWRAVANTPGNDGSFLYPDGTKHKKPLQETEAPVVHKDPALDSRLERLWGDE